MLFMPPWAIVHSRFWKAQVATMARSFRVVTYDGRGNGRSGRPATSAEYVDRVKVGDALAVLDATGTRRCLAVVHCGSAGTGLRLAAEHPDRVRAMVSIAPSLPLSPPLPERVGFPLREPAERYEDWAKANVHYWASEGGYDDYLQFFFGHCFPEPHSTKQIEDCVAWGHEIGPETLATLMDAPGTTREETLELLASASPALCCSSREPRTRSRRPIGARPCRRRLPGSELAVFDGCGHGVNARDPIRFNLLLRDYADRDLRRLTERFTFRRALTRSPRALLVSSPIGLGHAWRDVAIAEELRRLRPGLEIEWLAQDPVTHVLEACGETIHPASQLLAGESAHIAAASVRARAAGLPGLARDGRDPRRELHALPRRRPRGSLRPLDRRRGVGGRLLPPREPRAQDGALLLPDRLRRLAAACPRAAARGRADGGLQRRDDRPDRALPRGSRPRALRRRARRHRARSLRPRAAGDPAVDGGALRVQRVRPARATRQRFRRGKHCEPSSAGHRDDTVVVVAVGGSGVGSDLLARAVEAHCPARRARRSASHDPHRRPPHRPVVVRAPRRRRAAHVRPRGRANARGVRRRARAGRAHDDDGARLRRPAVRQRPAAPALRAERPRRAPASPLRP